MCELLLEILKMSNAIPPNAIMSRNKIIGVIILFIFNKSSVMGRRFKPNESERNEIAKILRQRRSEKGLKPLKTSTESKMISLYHHIVKTLGKPIDSITKHDLINFYATSKYADTSISWANSILHGYFDLSVPDTCEIVPSNTNSHDVDQITSILSRMIDAVSRGSGDSPSLASALVILLTCHKCSNVTQLNGLKLSDLVENGGVNLNGIVFAILPHMNKVKINDKSLIEYLVEISSRIEQDRRLEKSSHFLNLCSGIDDFNNYDEFYKFSREMLRTEMKNINSDKRFIAQNILELERRGFRGRGDSYEYIKWLLDQLTYS